MSVVTTTITIPLAELDRSDLPLAGGKGANLGAMFRAGLPVPPGFCVTAATYRVAIAALNDFIAGRSHRIDPDDTGALDAASAAIRARIEAHPINDQIAQAIRDAYAELSAAMGVEHLPVAVRSSATAEDLPDASFAGQQDTFLNIRGEAALLDAVRRCWSSLWTPRAIAYRERNNFRHDEVALAVVVQAMVDADVSGVLFTANPVSGNRTQTMINGSWGLGEAIVSGSVSPDGWVLDRQGKVLQAEIARKEVMVVYDQAGGAVEQPVPVAQQTRASLDARQLKRLVDLGHAAANHFGAPQDIEWSLRGDDLYLLQSRPITTLFPLPVPRPTDGELHAYLSFNGLQGVIEPFTPMGISLFQEFATLLQSLAREEPVPLGQQTLFVEAAGRLYFDATPAVRNVAGRRLLQIPFRVVDPTAGAAYQQLLTDERLAVKAGSRWATLKALPKVVQTIGPFVPRALKTVLRPVEARRKAEAILAQRVAHFDEVGRRPMSLAERAQMVRIMVRTGLPLIGKYMAPMVAPTVLTLVLTEALARRWGLDARKVMTLRQGLANNPTTEMDLALWHVSQTVKADPQARALFAGATPDVVATTYQRGALPPAVQQSLAAFLDGYGHRGVREIDAGMPRWSDAPEYIIGTIRNYLLLDDPTLAPDVHFAALAQAGEQARSDLVAEARRKPGGWYKAPVFNFLARRVRLMFGSREVPKFWAVRLISIYHRTLKRAGDELAAHDLIDHPDDVFFLRLDELEQAGHDGEMRAKIAERRALYKRELERHQLPRIMTSEGEIVTGRRPAGKANMLTGVGVSPGVREGVVRVIRDPHGAHLEPGEILVAPSTDPAWTPLFLTAGGLVMEAGGILSHGSVVAREYGIPAVVGVPDATTRLTTGQRVRIEGTEGTVELL